MFQLADHPALAHHGPVGELDHVFHVVGDEDDSIALLTQPVNQVEDLARPAQPSAARFVKDHDLGAKTRPGNGDGLRWPPDIRATGESSGQPHLEAVDDGRRLRSIAARSRNLSPSGSQLGHDFRARSRSSAPAQIVEKGEVLVTVR